MSVLMHRHGKINLAKIIIDRNVIAMKPNFDPSNIFLSMPNLISDKRLTMKIAQNLYGIVLRI